MSTISPNPYVSLYDLGLVLLFFCIKAKNSSRRNYRSTRRSLDGYGISHNIQKGSSQKRIQTAIIKATARRKSERRRRNRNPPPVGKFRCNRGTASSTGLTTPRSTFVVGRPLFPTTKSFMGCPLLLSLTQTPLSVVT